jgi:hypothetical protein
MLPKRAVLKTLPRLNMSLPIEDIYLKEVWDLLFVRMLTVNLQNLPRSTNKRSQPTCHLCGVSGHIRPHCPQIRTQKPWIKKQEPKKGKHGSNPPKPHHAPCQKWQFPQRAHPSCCHCGKTGQTKVECFKLKPCKPKENKIFEGLFSMMKSVLVRLDKLEKAHNHDPKVNKVWVRKDETIHPLRGSGLT